MQRSVSRNLQVGRLLPLASSNHAARLFVVSYRRLYSTPVEHKRGETLAAEAALASAGTKKTRVGLRPAPRPVQGAGSTQNASSSPAPTSNHDMESYGQQYSSQASGSTTPLQPATNPGIIQTMKEDFESAERLQILAAPPEGAGRFKLAFHRGKELVKFYFRGAKLILSNAKTSRQLSTRERSGGPPLTRDEWHLIRTSRGDLWRLVPFVLLTLILEEAVPLVVLYLPGMLPSTCILPSQKARIAQKQAVQQSQVAMDRRASLAALLSSTTPTIESLDSGSLSTMCGLFSLSRIAPDFLLRRKLRGHLEFLARDDKFLLGELSKARTLAVLTAEQLRDAILNRGLVYAFASRREDQLNTLESWVGATKAGDVSLPLTLVARHTQL